MQTIADEHTGRGEGRVSNRIVLGEVAYLRGKPDLIPIPRWSWNFVTLTPMVRCDAPASRLLSVEQGYGAQTPRSRRRGWRPGAWLAACQGQADEFLLRSASSVRLG